MITNPATFLFSLTRPSCLLTSTQQHPSPSRSYPHSTESFRTDCLHLVGTIGCRKIGCASSQMTIENLLPIFDAS